MNLNSIKQQSKDINKKLLKIQFTQKKDIKIQWNFNGMLMPKAYRKHVFMCLSFEEKQIQKAHNHLQSCYQFFKCGDIYSFATPNQKKLNWVQKTKVDKFRTSFSQQYRRNRQSRQCYTYRQLLSLCNRQQPCFVVLFCDTNHSAEQIQALIKQLRYKQAFKCFVFIVSCQFKQNSVDYSNGYFKIVQKQSKSDQLQKIYKFYNERLACLSAKVNIQSITGDIFVQEGVWKPYSFTGFSRTIYYPLATQFIDIIQTFKLYSQKINQWKFVLKLQYTLLNGQKFCDSKQIKVKLYQDIQKCVTYNQDAHKHKKYQPFIGAELENNPFYRVTSLESGVQYKNI